LEKLCVLSISLSWNEIISFRSSRAPNGNISSAWAWSETSLLHVAANRESTLHSLSGWPTYLVISCLYLFWFIYIIFSTSFLFLILFWFSFFPDTWFLYIYENSYFGVHEHFFEWS
jgi:hypothetical protein